MATIIWQSHGLSQKEINRRAGARRRWNLHRQEQARQQQHQVWQLLCTWGHGRGIQRAIAAELDVSEATISRDIRVLKLAEWW